MPNLYVWDFHGTLEKGNELAVREICQAVFEGHGYYRKVTLKEVQDLYGRSWGNYFKALIPSLNEETVKAMVEEAVSMSEKISRKYIKPMDYALDTLLLLKTKGHTNIVVSNCRQYRVDAFLESIGLSPLMAAMIGLCEEKVMLDADVAKQKAAHIMKFANGRKFDRTFVIGDKETDVDAGLLAGAQTVLFNPRKTNVDTKAHHTITDLRDVLRL
jgi:phosphoglycolate phosphatase-like HAD superfamily hydrolase